IPHNNKKRGGPGKLCRVRVNLAMRMSTTIPKAYPADLSLLRSQPGRRKDEKFFLVDLPLRTLRAL
ncbi:MAG: hypothetical protein ABI557_03910, partial [Aureliella sp.]